LNKKHEVDQNVDFINKEQEMEQLLEFINKGRERKHRWEFMEWIDKKLEENNVEITPEPYTEWWFGEVGDAFACYYFGEITFMEFFFSHYKTMLVLYFILFQFLAIIATAFVTFDERSLIADLQGRKGPRKTGIGGFLQPIGDASKLIFKEKVTVRFIERNAFTIASWASLFAASITWCLIPLGLNTCLFNSDFSAFFLLNFSLLHIFAIAFASWSSNSKYAFLGGFRTIAQMVSFELCISLATGNLFKWSKNLSIISFDYLSTEIATIIFYLVGLALIFFVASLAELNRHPFDLPEAEAELVAGYNVEYTGIRFALFFLSEYLSIIYYAILINKMYIGENSFFISLISIGAIIYLIISIRALIPRYRYDQLMRTNWKFFLPLLVIGAYLVTVIEYFMI